MITKKELLDEYIISRGGTTIAVPLDDKDYDVSWDITVRKIREHKYIGKSIEVTLQQGISLPEDGSDLYKFIPPETASMFDDDSLGISSFINSTPSLLDSGLRTIFLREDIENMVSWIVSASYDKVSGQIVFENFAGHEGETALMLYELNIDSFDISYLDSSEQNWFVDYLYAILDIIIGYKFRRIGSEEGEAFLNDGKEAKDRLMESIRTIFVYPTLLFA